MNCSRWFGALTVAAGILLAAAPSATANGEGGVGVRLLDEPASAAADPRARLYVIDHLAPGTTIERRIEVSNTTAASVDVATYAAAAVIDHGSFTGSAGHSPNELSSWTTVPPGVPALVAGGSAIVTFTIAVPSDAAPGERYGVVWAEVQSPPGDGVVEVNRVGIRLYISVGPGGAPAADFTITAMTASRTSDGIPVVSATVRNTGGRALDISGSLQLDGGPGGLSAGPYAATLGTTLAIATTEDVRIVLSSPFPDGPWQASIVLRSGLTERTATAEITFPPSGSAPPVAVDAPAGSSLSLVVVALITAFVVATLIAVLLLVKRRRAGASAASSAA